MSNNIYDYNDFYNFMRCAIVHFYSKCMEESYYGYYSTFLDLTLEQYLEFLQVMYEEINKEL